MSDSRALYNVNFKKWGQLYETRQFNEALAVISECIKLDPEDYQAYYALAHTYANLVNVEAAEDNYAKSLALAPENLKWLVHYQRGMGMSIASQMDLSMAAHDEVVRLNPDYPHAYDQLAGLYRIKGQHDLAKTLSDVSSLLTAYKAIYATFANLGHAYMRTRNYESALRSYLHSIEVAPDEYKYDAYYQLGMGMSNLGKIEESIAAYEAVLDFNITCHDAYDRLWELYPYFGKNNLATTLLDVGKQILNGAVTPQTFFNLGHQYAYVVLGEQADRCYQHALAIAPTEVKFAVHYERGMGMSIVGNHLASAEAYRNVSALNPEYLPAYAGLAEKYEALGDVNKQRQANRNLAFHALKFINDATWTALELMTENCGRMLKLTIFGVKTLNSGILMSAMQIAKQLADGKELREALESCLPELGKDALKQLYETLASKATFKLLGKLGSKVVGALVSEILFPDELNSGEKEYLIELANKRESQKQSRPIFSLTPPTAPVTPIQTAAPVQAPTIMPVPLPTPMPVIVKPAAPVMSEKEKRKAEKKKAKLERKEKVKQARAAYLKSPAGQAELAKKKAKEEKKAARKQISRMSQAELFPAFHSQTLFAHHEKRLMAPPPPPLSKPMESPMVAAMQRRDEQREKTKKANQRARELARIGSPSAAGMFCGYTSDIKLDCLTTVNVGTGQPAPDLYCYPRGSSGPVTFFSSSSSLKACYPNASIRYIKD